MSDAKAKAEARRQAILARGSNRLAKLTSSARGDDYPVNFHDDPPLPLPTSRPLTPSIDPHTHPLSTSAPQLQGSNFPPVDPPLSFPSTYPQGDDPISAMLAAMGNPNAGFSAGIPSMTSSSMQNSPNNSTSVRPTWPMILLRIVSIVALVFYAVFNLEPRQHEDVTLHDVPTFSRNERWLSLTRLSGQKHGVQPIPFIWIFLTLQLALQSANTFLWSQRSEPSMLVSFILPMLPPPISLIARNSLGYASMIGDIVDDLALCLVLLGAVVWISGTA